MNPNDTAFIIAIAIWHMARKGGSRSAEHQVMIDKLLAMLKKEPDTRVPYGKELCESLTAGGLTHGIGNSYYRLTIGSLLLALPAAEMEELRKAKEVHLHINSPGGDGNTALAILEICGPKLTEVRIEHAGSSAAILAILAPGRRIISKTGDLMLHGISGCVMGTAEEFRRRADWLDAKTGPVAKRLAERTGQKLETILGWLGDTDVTFTAEQALAFGLVDVIE